jgi:hypothetical protein
MFHACFASIVICFVYTSWHFYAFSGTNLLTRCHSASSCFLLFLYFRKVILGFGRNESQTSYFFRHEDRVQSRDGGGPGAGHTIGWRGSHPGRATRWCGPLVHPLTSLFRLYILSEAKTLNQSVYIHEKFRSAAAIEDQFRGTEVSILAPCQDGELLPEPSPSTPPPSPSTPLPS